MRNRGLTFMLLESSGCFNVAPGNETTAATLDPSGSDTGGDSGSGATTSGSMDLDGINDGEELLRNEITYVCGTP